MDDPIEKMREWFRELSDKEIHYPGNYNKRGVYHKEYEEKLYETYYHTLPFSVQLAQERISLFHEMYENYVLGFVGFDSEVALVQRMCDQNLEQRKSWFVFGRVADKLRDIEDDIPRAVKNLKNVENRYKGIDKEELILIDLIEHYREVLSKKDEQLNLFGENLLVTKQVADWFTEALVEILEKRLKRLNPDYKPRNNDVKQVLTIPKRPKGDETALNQKQTLVLMSLLKEARCIHPEVNNTRLAELFAQLTGYSHKQLRKDLSSGKIEYVTDKKEDIEGLLELFKSWQDELTRTNKV